MRNLKSDVTEDQLREKFEQFGKVERVKKVKDYGFVHFDDREHALKALEDLNGTVGSPANRASKKIILTISTYARLVCLFIVFGMFIVPSTARNNGHPAADPLSYFEIFSSVSLRSSTCGRCLIIF